MSFNLADPCLWCIEGSAPAGLHDVLGPVYKPCPACFLTCGLCEGEGLFPADFTCIPCFLNTMADLGLAPIFCAGCSGVVDLVPIDTVPEVTSHADH